MVITFDIKNNFNIIIYRKYLLNQLTNETIINCFQENNKSNPLNSIIKYNDEETNYHDFENGNLLLKIKNKKKNNNNKK